MRCVCRWYNITAALEGCHNRCGSSLGFCYWNLMVFLFWIHRTSQKGHKILTSSSVQAKIGARQSDGSDLCRPIENPLSESTVVIVSQKEVNQSISIGYDGWHVYPSVIFDNCSANVWTLVLVSALRCIWKVRGVMAVTTRPASTETIKNFDVTKKIMLMDGWIVDVSERESDSGAWNWSAFERTLWLNIILRGAATPGEELFFLRGGNAQMRSKHEA